MGKVLTDNKHYTAIAAAIREKNGTDETYKPAEMADAIAAIETGGSSEGMPEEALNITGNCKYRFANDGWNWYIETYGKQIETNNINDCSYMFADSTGITEVGFEINCSTSSIYSGNDMSFMFNGCNRLKEIPKINNCAPKNMERMFYNTMIRYAPDDIEDWFDWKYIEGESSQFNGKTNEMFSNCASLRIMPMGMLNHQNPNVYYSYTIYYSLCYNCSSLDKIENIPIYYQTQYSLTSNGYVNAFNNASRLSEITFQRNEDGTPIEAKWKNQSINLSAFTGYAHSLSYYFDTNRFNHGITSDKEVKDDATYQALKDNPDWVSTKLEYSRYNHDSAVNTINSLPDTSEYLSTVGGTNTIKFKGDSGSLTDGGAINTMTEEEIAVATAKGWTVSFA